MLDGNDKETLYAIRQLEELVATAAKPIALWVGAGASAWCDYPLWRDVAAAFDAQFAKFEPEYPRLGAHDALSAEDYPRVFQMCRDANLARYHTLLAETFAARPVTALFRRFIDALKRISPLHVLTTNIDEQLEQNLPGVVTVQASDIERCIDLLRRNESFICKPHGTVSQIGSAIFTASDYARLLENSAYQVLLSHIFRESTVVFIGYGLADSYVVSALASNANTRPIFGDGPHFVVAGPLPRSLPFSIKRIGYKPDPAAGHRGPLQVVEMICSCRDWQIPQRATGTGDRRLRSAHFLSAIYPHGNITTSQTLDLGHADGTAISGRAVRQIVVGDGMTGDEMPSVSTLMHDLVVGLICFDQIYLPVLSAGVIHDYLSPEYFWELVATETLRLVRSDCDEGVAYFEATDVTGGGLSTFHVRNPGDKHISTRELLSGQIRPVPGAEAKADALLASLAEQTEELGTRQYASVIERTNGLLLLPQIRKMLGRGGGTPINSLPRWLVFPILRLARIVRVGVIADMLRLGSVKLLFGARELAGPAFSAIAGDLWADDMASYILTQRYNSDLGAIVMSDKSLLRQILHFRESQEGERLRREIFEKLAVPSGSDLTSSIDAGLRSSVPPTVLQKANDRMSALLTPQGHGVKITPAVWSDMPLSGDPLARWRRVSREAFKKHCSQFGIGIYDLCPCGSGEKRKFCCEEALSK